MMREKEQVNTNHLVTDIKSIILTARANAVSELEKLLVDIKED